MRTKVEKKIRVLLIIRICLWIVAAVSTIYWISFSVKLHMEGIYDVHTYATILRPVLYTCLVISLAAVCMSFVLHALAVRIRRGM